MIVHMTNVANITRIVSQLLLSGVLCFIAACQQTPVQPRPHPQQDPATLKIAKIDWGMKRVDEGKALRIDYRVTNVSNQRIFLSDIIHEYKSGGRIIPNRQRIAVTNDTEPRVVRFVRGRLSSKGLLYLPLLDPGSRPIEPGQTVSGDAEVPLPLVARHYDGAATVEPLERTPTAAVLALGYFRVEPEWTKLQLADGGSVSVSNLTDRMEMLLSDIKPLP
jgi:hypothetical protein